MMRGTIADPLTAPEAARMAESIRAVFNVNAKALKLLPTSGRRFSVRQWIENDGHDAEGRGSVVFISARYVDMSVCAQLLTLWLDMAMNTLMTGPRTRDLKCWFFVDELGALHRLPALEKGLQTARNFGGAIVLGLHAYAKLKEVYGENMAMTLSSLARTKLILGTADRETATWCSDFIGHRQVRDMEEGYTYGYNNARDAVSLTPRKHIEPLLLPDQLMNLSRLSGYIKFPDGFPAAPIRLKPISRLRLAETFIGRAEERVVVASSHRQAPAGVSPNPPASTAAEHPSSNDDGAGKPVVPKQGVLALEPGASDRTPTTPEGLKEADRARANDPTDKPSRAAQPGEKTRGAKASSDAAPIPIASRTGSGVRNDRTTAESDPEKDPKEAGRSDAPPAKAPASRSSDTDKAAGRTGEPEARRLMVEDGLPERDTPSREGPDLGDLEL